MSITWSLSGFLEILRSPKLLAWVALVCALILFIPASWLQGNFIQNVRVQYGIYLVLAMCAASAKLLIELACWGWDKFQEFNAYRKRIKYLANLSHEEKRILKGYLKGMIRTQTLSIQDGVVAGLEHAMIIYPATAMGRSAFDRDYNIQPWAWDYLNKHPEILMV